MAAGVTDDVMRSRNEWEQENIYQLRLLIKIVEDKKIKSRLYDIDKKSTDRIICILYEIKAIYFNEKEDTKGGRLIDYIKKSELGRGFGSI